MQEKNKRNFDEIKMRLLQFAETQGIPKGEFYEKISVPQSNFGGKSMESSLASSKITEILIRYPELNSDWLLLGKGEMLRSKVEDRSPISADKDKKIFELQEKYISLLERYNRLVEERVSSPASLLHIEAI